MTPRCLDLFCGAGGATKGLQRAGFHVTGVDIKHQPRYCGDEFHQADAMEFPLGGFDFIWASPPCQGYSDLRTLSDNQYPVLIEPVRARLIDSQVPWVIENVCGAPLRGFMLCGMMFGLKVFRHRVFDASAGILAPSHPRHDGQTGTHRWPYKSVGGYLQVTGNGGNYRLAEGRAAMGIDWMNKAELSQAIPPAYSQFIGEQMMPHVLAAATRQEARHD